MAQELGRPGLGLSSYEPQFPIVKEAATDRVPPATAEPVRRVTEVCASSAEKGWEWEGPFFERLHARHQAKSCTWTIL